MAINKDTFARDRFVEMFGDPELPPGGSLDYLLPHHREGLSAGGPWAETVQVRFGEPVLPREGTADYLVHHYREGLSVSGAGGDTMQVRCPACHDGAPVQVWWSRTPTHHPIVHSWLRCRRGHRWRQNMLLMMDIIGELEPDAVGANFQSPRTPVTESASAVISSNVPPQHDRNRNREHPISYGEAPAPIHIVRNDGLVQTQTPLSCPECGATLGLRLYWRDGGPWNGSWMTCEEMHRWEADMDVSIELAARLFE